MKMIVTERVTHEVDATAFRCILPVRYEEEDIPNDYPHRKNDVWDITIDIDTGQIRDWPKGVRPLNVGMKVTDNGTYHLISGDKVIGTIEDDYVPSCIPEKYGDYVDFNIDGDGKITNWRFDAAAAAERFFGDDDD